MSDTLPPDELAALRRWEREAIGLPPEDVACARFIRSSSWRRRPNGNIVLSRGGRVVTIVPDRARPGRFSYVVAGTWHGPFASLAEAKADAFALWFRNRPRRRVRRKAAKPRPRRRLGPHPSLPTQEQPMSKTREERAAELRG